MYNIPMNVPVFIQDLVEDTERTLYSKAKLKVFYIGQTGDNRLFTEDFANKLIKTLPLTPVVGYYNDDSDDFIGHNSTQFVYGVVPESAVIEFVEEEHDGNKQVFAVTDVILYTGRKDNIGKVAQKIVGKQHSLELNPDTLKYKVNRDNQGRFLNIEFLEGEFVGLSVLGDDDHPAFKGSEFFTSNKDYEEVMSDHQERFNRFLNLLNSDGGKIEVFNSEAYFAKCAETFANITMQDFIQKLYQAFEKEGVYCYVVENTYDYAIISCWNAELERAQYLKYNISMANDEIVLGEYTEVFARYLTQEELDAVNSINTATTSDDEEEVPASNPSEEEEEEKTKEEQDVDTATVIETTEEVATATTTEDEEEQKTEDEEVEVNAAKDEEKDDEEVTTNCTTVTTDSDTNAQGELTNAEESDEPKKEEEESNTDSTDDKQEKEDENEVGNATTSNSTATLSDSERAELEQYRRAEKLAMIAEYASELSDEVINAFKSNVDSYSKDELEAKLAIEFRKTAKTMKTQMSGSTVVTTFGLLRPAENYNENDPADVINRYKK